MTSMFCLELRSAEWQGCGLLRRSIKGGGGDAGHEGPNLHKLSNLAQLRLALPEPARELPGTPLSGWKRAGRLP